MLYLLRSKSRESSTLGSVNGDGAQFTVVYAKPI